jgi:hypothetical protein
MVAFMWQYYMRLLVCFFAIRVSSALVLPEQSAILDSYSKELLNEDGTWKVSFQLEFGPEKKYGREFYIDSSNTFEKDCSVKHPLIVVDSHGFMMQGVQEQWDFSQLRANIDFLADQLSEGTTPTPVLLVTAWGSEDAVDSEQKLVNQDANAGWNALSWGSSYTRPRPAHGDLPDSDRNENPCGTLCGKDRDEYPCYESHYILDDPNKGLGFSGRCQKPETESGYKEVSKQCGTMSAQDDVNYMRKVIGFARREVMSSQNKSCLQPKVLMVGQSMGGMISMAAAQQLDPGLVDFIVPVSGGAARGHWSAQSQTRKPWPPGKEEPWLTTDGIPVLHLHGIFDPIVPTCLSKEFVMQEFGAIAPNSSIPYDPVEETCLEPNIVDSGSKHVEPSCKSTDSFHYSSLETTARSYVGQEDLSLESDFTWDWYMGVDEGHRETPGFALKYVDFGKMHYMMLFNGGHCLPFQDEYCSWQQPQGSESGDKVFVRMVADFVQGRLQRFV